MLTEQRHLLLRLYQHGKDGFTKKSLQEEERNNYITTGIEDLIKLQAEINVNDDDIALLYGALWLLNLHRKNELESEKYYQLLVPLFNKFKERCHNFTDLYSDVMKTYAWKMLKTDKECAKQLLNEIITSGTDQSAKKWAQTKLSFFNNGNNGQADAKNITPAELKQATLPVELSEKNNKRLKVLDRFADVILECNPDKIVSVLFTIFPEDDQPLQLALAATVAFLQPMIKIIKLMNDKVTLQSGVPKEIRQEFFSVYRQVLLLKI